MTTSQSRRSFAASTIATIATIAGTAATRASTPSAVPTGSTDRTADRRTGAKIAATLTALLAAQALAACSNGPPGRGASAAATSPPFTAAPPPTREQRAGGAYDVNGIISWPNGDPAVNVQVDVYPAGFPNLDDLHTVQPVVLSTGVDGSYSIQCTLCPSLGMEVDVPATGGDSQHGGSGCILLLVDDEEHTTVSVRRSGGVDWHVFNAPCSPQYVTPGALSALLPDYERDPTMTAGKLAERGSANSRQATDWPA